MTFTSVPTTSTAPAARTSTARRVRLLVGATAGALALTAGLGACGSSGFDSAADTTDPAVLVAADPSSSVVADPAEVTPYAGGNESTAGVSGPAPVIDSFQTPDDIDCHNGNLQDFSVSWTTTDAHKVTISIDGPGIYAEYPVDGDTSLPFNCSTSHTFLLTAYGSNGQKATRTITLEPRNAESEATGDEDEGDLRRVPAGTTAKIVGGATGTGATDAQCGAVADALDGLYDVAATTPNGDAANATMEVAAGIQAGAEAAGCFFGGAGM